MDRNLSVGALVGPNSGMALFSIAQKNKLRLTVSLPEKHASSVNEGIVAQFTVNSIPGKNFEAHLSRNSGVISQENRSMTLEFDVPNPGHCLKRGGICTGPAQSEKKCTYIFCYPRKVFCRLNPEPL